jgi:hypothetical protein
MPVRRRRSRPIIQLIAILLAVALVDTSAVVYAFATHRNDPPPLPPFTASESSLLVRRGVDAYASSPHEFGFTTTPGRPQIPANGHVRVIVDGRKRFDPDSSLRYGLAALAEFTKTGNREWLDRARTAIREVLQTMNGGLVPHELPQTDLVGKPLPDGWVSAETQGLLLSAVCRLFSITQESQWRSDADTVFDSLLRFRGGFDSAGHPYSPWLSRVDDFGQLWFEYMPQGTTPTQKVTSHLFAVIGIYDYSMISHSTRHRVATQAFLAGASTAEVYTPRLRYEAAAAWESPAMVSRSWESHHALVAQLDALSRITGMQVFKDLFKTFRADEAVPAFATTGLLPVDGVDSYFGSAAGRALPPTGPPAHADGVAPERSGEPAKDPDVKAAAALTALAEFSAGGHERSLLRSVEIVDGLLGTSTHGLVPHTFPVRHWFGEPLVVPWYSAQTQGLLLSALVRLEAATGQQRWADEAGAVFASLQLSRAYPGYSNKEPPAAWMSYVGDETSRHRLWFEKYGRQEGTAYNDYPSFVIDAHIAAVIGIYDYWRMTKSPVAERMFDGGVSTLLARLPDIRRIGGVSESALHSNIYNLEHHRTVTRQLWLLSRMTGNKALAIYARRFAMDAT